MERYTDVEAVKLKVRRYLIPNVEVDGTVDSAVAERWFLKLLDEAPTADVVPKSEVDRLKAVMKEMDEQRAYTINMLGESLEPAKAELEAYQNAKREVEEYKHNWQKIHDSYNADCLEHYNKGRQDAAREIFEEIDTMIFGSIIPNDCAIIGIAKLAELKKKYTEDTI